jgi:hypothetical protein
MQIHRLGVGRNGFVVPPCPSYTSNRANPSRTRSSIADGCVEVNRGVKTNNFDGVFFHHFQQVIEPTSGPNGC